MKKMHLGFIQPSCGTIGFSVSAKSREETSFNRWSETTRDNERGKDLSVKVVASYTSLDAPHTSRCPLSILYPFLSASYHPVHSHTYRQTAHRCLCRKEPRVLAYTEDRHEVTQLARQHLWGKKRMGDISHTYCPDVLPESLIPPALCVHQRCSCRLNGIHTPVEGAWARHLTQIVKWLYCLALFC